MAASIVSEQGVDFADIGRMGLARELCNRFDIVIIAARKGGVDHRAHRIGQRRIGRHEHGRKRSEEHTSELQSLMRISYAVFCLKKKKKTRTNTKTKSNHRRTNIIQND